METLPVIDELWDFSDPAGSAERFEGLLSSDDESFVAEVRTQVARTQGLRGLFEEAHATLDEVASLLPRVAPRVEARYLLERGRVWNSSGVREKARELFLNAFDVCKRVGDDDLTIDAAHMVAIVEEPKAAIEWSLLGFRLVEETRQERAKRWTGPLANNIAWTYHDMGSYSTALEFFEKGLAFRLAQAKEPGLRVARWAVARCKRSLGRFEEALEEQRAILAEHPDADGYVREEIGECLLAMDRGAEATPHFARAYELLSQDEWFVKNESARLERMRTLGS
jgi:tetratricopeptide (TPR) repeat protein